MGGHLAFLNMERMTFGGCAATLELGDCTIEEGEREEKADAFVVESLHRVTMYNINNTRLACLPTYLPTCRNTVRYPRLVKRVQWVSLEHPYDGGIY